MPNMCNFDGVVFVCLCIWNMVDTVKCGISVRPGRHIYNTYSAAETVGDHQDF